MPSGELNTEEEQIGGQQQAGELLGQSSRRGWAQTDSQGFSFLCLQVWLEKCIELAAELSLAEGKSGRTW